MKFSALQFTLSSLLTVGALAAEPPNTEPAPLEALPAAEVLPAAPVDIPEPPMVEAIPAGPVIIPANETARFLAGLPPQGDPVAMDLATRSSWKRHAAQMDQAWAEIEDGRLSKVRAWSATHIPEASRADGTMFYMFSGPDFIYADAIYPGAKTYVFCGIEPIGDIPDLTKVRQSRIPGSLHSLRASLDDIFSFSFFITNQMKKDLRNHEFEGTLPVLCVFLARTGKTVQSIEYVGLDKDGKLSPIAEPERDGKITAPGVKITFHGSNPDDRRTLYHFRTDISNSGLKGSGFLEFCQGLAPGNSLVKSASYLMHNSYFSTIRSFLLENSGTLVQDDSGIPIAFFPPDQWDLRLFGRYPGPITLFKERSQKKLFELYRNTDPTPLDFGIGYRHRKGESMLMVAEQRTEVPTDNAPKAIATEALKAVPVATPQ